MNWLFNLLYWSTFGTEGTWCYAAGRRAQPMPFGAVSAPSLVPRSVHHDWPHSTLTQQPKHPEFSRSPAFPTAEGETSSPAKGLVDSGITHSSHAAWVNREDHKPWLFIVFALYFILLFLFSFSREKRQLSCTKGGNIEQEMKMSGVCICVTEQGAWMHGALQNISLCFSNIRGGCSTQGNAQTGLSLLQWFVWHTAHVSVKML